MTFKIGSQRSVHTSYHMYQSLASRIPTTNKLKAGKEAQVNLGHPASTSTYYVQQACFFNVWPPSGANRFAEILSLAANSLSLAEKYLSLLRKSFKFRGKIIEFRWEALEFIQISLSLAKILSLGALEFSDKCWKNKHIYMCALLQFSTLNK